MGYGRLLALGLATLVSGALVAPSAGAEPTEAPAAPTDSIRYDDFDTGISAEFNAVGKWGTTDLTYSFENGTSDMVGTTEQDAVRQAFDLWSAVTPLRFTQVASGGIISIRWAVGNHGDGGNFDGKFGVLAHAFFPSSSSLGGDAHFDDAEDWSMTLPLQSGQIDLVTVAAHEFGHSLGLGHSNVSGALMYAYYGGPHRFLHVDDIAGIQAQYGSGGTPPPPPPAFSVNDVTVTEPASGSLRAEFTVSLSAPSATVTSVILETFDVTAFKGLDYGRVKRTIRIPAGQTSKVVKVAVKSDKLAEQTETYAVTLTEPKNTTIGDGAAVGTILDID